MSETPDLPLRLDIGEPLYASPDAGGVNAVPDPAADVSPKPVLGREVRTPLKQLDVFPNPGVQVVTMEAVEFTSLCPVTGQPDMGTVSIQYIPKEWCLESKSLKLYLWTFRTRGVFCEALAQEIAATVANILKPAEIQVTVQQNPRGGIGVRAMARLTEPPPADLAIPKGGSVRDLFRRPRHK
jgi:7-cyano-7-deazaguanine reductase